LARWLEACPDPVEAFTNFRRIRIPRVHGVQRLSLSNARFKHMRDSSAQKDSITTGKGSVHGNSDWVWGSDPVGGWDTRPFVATAIAAGGSIDWSVNLSRSEPPRSDATSVAAPLPSRTQRPRERLVALRSPISQRLAGPRLRRAPRQRPG